MQVIPPHPHRVPTVILALLGTSLALACGGSGEGLIEPTTGNLEITARTTGESPDPDGYTVSIDGGAGEALGVSGTLEREGVTSGEHRVELSGVDGNCVVEGANPRTVTVIADQLVRDTFAVACTATRGSLSVTTVTTGSVPDPDGYSLVLDNGPPQPVDDNGIYSFVSVAPGDHTVELAGVASPCVVFGANPQTASVSAGATATVAFSVDCTPPVINAWSNMTSGTDSSLYAVWGSAASNVYAVGYHFLDDIGEFSESTILRYDGSSWSEPIAGSQMLEQLWLMGVSGSSASDVYAVGEGFDENGGSAFAAILHYDGQGWTAVPGPTLTPELEGALYSVSSASATEACAVGFTFNIINGEEKATALRYTGTSWTSTLVPGSNHLVLHDVWCASGGTGLAVGDDNTVPAAPTAVVVRYDGSSWQPLAGAGDRPLNAVWGTGPSDVFAVGEGGAILHFDGSTLAPMTSPTLETLVDVYGNTSRDVFAVGLTGTILHYDGTAWAVQPSGVTGGLFGVWTSLAEAFAVGEAGRIVHGVPGGPLPDLAARMAARAPIVRRDIGRAALERKWPRPGVHPH